MRLPKKLGAVELMNAVRLVFGVVFSLLAFAYMNASSNDYRRLFLVATGIGLLAILTLEGPARGPSGGVRWLSRVLFGFAVIVTAYGAVALLSMFVSGEH